MQATNSFQWVRSNLMGLKNLSDLLLDRAGPRSGKKLENYNAYVFLSQRHIVNRCGLRKRLLPLRGACRMIAEVAELTRHATYQDRRIWPNTFW
jgi:hypothetical protein